MGALNCPYALVALVAHVAHLDDNGQAEAFASRYRAGLTLRQIGAEVGLAHTTVRFHLRKLPGYRRMITTTLVQRVREAERAYTITRARAQERRLKHAVAMLAQKRPAMAARIIERTRPKACRECARAIEARDTLGLWVWQCGWCGEGGITPRTGIASLIGNRGPARFAAFAGTIPAHSRRRNDSKARQ